MIQLPAVYADLSSKQRAEVREQYSKLQGGLCCLCKAPLSGKPDAKIVAVPITPEVFPPNFFKWPVHLHHSHRTGKTLGAVHSKCNAVAFEYYGQ